MCHGDTMKTANQINIRQLHDKTGELVRAAGQSPPPVHVTDRGKVVACLVSPESVPKPRRKRKLLTSYREYLKKASINNSVLSDLDAVRGDR